MAQLSTKLPWELAQTKWPSEINPFLALPILQGLQLNDIRLTAATPKAINHLLQRKPQGWFLLDNSANSTVWRTQPFNDLTITLEAAADTTISLWIF